MTSLVINAISVKEGGAIVVLREIVDRIAEMRPSWALHLAVHSSAAPQLRLSREVQLHTFPAVEDSFWRVRIWYESGLIRLLRQVEADLLFSQTNYLPYRRTPCPSLLLVQHAGHFSPVFDGLMIKSLGTFGRIGWRLKRNWVRASVRRANAVVVQTRTLAVKIDAEVKKDHKKTHVIAHGPGQIPVSEKTSTPPPSDGILKLGYITKFGVQKNFEVLFKAAALLKKKGIDVRVVLTLDETLPSSQGVLRIAAATGIADQVENWGDLNPAQVRELYSKLHIFVFPSLCESFGFPIVEAMACGLPVLVADTDSNREVATVGADYFPPHCAESLCSHVIALLSDQAFFRKRSEESLRRSRELSWDRSVEETIRLMESLVARMPS